MKNVLVLLACLFLLPACSGSGEEQMALAVDNSYCPAGASTLEAFPEVLQVETYRVVISGDDFDPIELFFPGNTLSTGTIGGIPKGEGRMLLVEAINKTGQVICRRSTTVNIKGGQQTPVHLTLLSVPFVTNLSNGNVVTATRLVFKGYGEPAGGIEILDFFNNVETSLVDLSTSSDLVSPSISNAGFLMTPEVLPIGPHTFTIRDAGTGESSQVSVILVAPGREPGRAVNVAGDLTDSFFHTVGMLGSFPEVLHLMGP